jgi:dienelactone hydrolase
MAGKEVPRMETLPFRIDAAGLDLPIAGDVRLPAGAGRAPVVALAHGFLGWKDEGPLPAFADGLAQAGLVAVSFSFSGSGVPAGADEITDVDAFAANTWSREVRDLGRVVTAIFERMLPGAARFDIYRIGALGEGAGGAIALLEASGDTRVRALVALAPEPSLADAIPEEAREASLARGELRFRDPRSNRPLRIDGALARDLRVRAADLDVHAAAGRLRVPFLVIHGAGDRARRLQNAKALFYANAEFGDMRIVDGVARRFEAGRPETDLAREAALQFLGAKLG